LFFRIATGKEIAADSSNLCFKNISNANYLNFDFVKNIICEFVELIILFEF